MNNKTYTIKDEFIKYSKAFGLLTIAGLYLGLGLETHNIIGATLGILFVPIFLGMTLPGVLEAE